MGLIRKNFKKRVKNFWERPNQGDLLDKQTTNTNQLFNIALDESFTFSTAVPATDTRTSSPLDRDMLVNFIAFSSSVQQAAGVLTNPLIEFLIGNIPVFSIVPSNTIDWQINQIQDVTDFTVPSGSTISIRVSVDAATGAFWIMKAGFGITGLVLA